MLFAATRTPSVEEKPVSSSSIPMSLTTWLLWSTHLIGSDSILARPSTSTPPRNNSADTMSNGRPQLVGRDPSFTTIFSTKLSGRTSVRFLCSRIPSADAGTTMPTITSTKMPIPSRTPKSRIMGTLEMRKATKATTAVKAAANNGGARLATVSAIGWASLSSTTSSSMRLWIWIAKSIPIPMRIGRPEIVTSDRSMPMRPRIENDQITPMTTAASGSSRHLTRNMTSSTIAISANAAAPRLSMPPWR